MAALVPALAFRLVAAAWSALLSGGTVIGSIELAAGGRPSLGALVRGIRFSPAVFLALALQLVPLQVLSRAMDTSSVQQALALAVGAPVVLVLAVRAVAWIPMIVDRRLGPMQAFRASWEVTRGSSGRIVVVWAVLVAFATSAGALALGNPITVHVVGLAVGPVFSVVLAELYLALVADRTNPPAERSVLAEGPPPAPAAESLPTRGSGWSRNAGTG
ncbi:MAG: hypothetical protein HYZ29_30525 [Myxococcales bacterium]|nr:hypothetical protein [Myxococcales bacterium]